MSHLCKLIFCVLTFSLSLSVPPSDFFSSRSFSHDVKVLEFYLIFFSLAQSIFASLKVKFSKSSDEKKARTRCCNNFLIDPFHLSMSIHRFECKFFSSLCVSADSLLRHTWRNNLFWTFLSRFSSLLCIIIKTMIRYQINANYFLCSHLTTQWFYWAAAGYEL